MSLLTEKAKCAEEMAMVKQELEWTKNDARAHVRVVRDLTNTLAAKERECEALRADGDSGKRRWQIVKAKKHPY